MTELEALRRVAEAARKWRNAQHATEQYETFRALCAALDALAAVDDSPAPAAEPEGEVVEVVADVFGDNDGFFVRERGHIPLPHNLHIATIRARVPLPRVPEVVGEVG